MDRGSRLPDGWVATAAGGVVGAIAVGGATGFLAGAYVESQSYEGFEGLGIFLLWIAVGAFAGTVGGSAALLKLRRHSRPLASGIVFAVLGYPLLIGLMVIGVELPPAWAEPAGAIGGPVLAVPAAAVATRLILTRRPRRTGP